jgi:hypothetical protein
MTPKQLFEAIQRAYVAVFPDCRTRWVDRPVTAEEASKVWDALEPILDPLLEGKSGRPETLPDDFGSLLFGDLGRDE